MARRKLEVGTKEAVFAAIDQNEKLNDVAVRFGVHRVTIYRWLRERKPVEAVVPSTVTA